jgi:hypothetical protein
MEYRTEPAKDRESGLTWPPQIDTLVMALVIGVAFPPNNYRKEQI